MPSDALTCFQIVDAVLDEHEVVSLGLRAHVERCSRCRDDLRTQRALLDVLRRGLDAPPAVPDDLLETIRSEVAQATRKPIARLARAARVAPYVGGVVVATAAGALLAGRRRNPLGVLAGR